VNPIANKEKMKQIMFETFSVPAFYVASPAELILTSTGCLSGIVMDCGHGVTYTYPVHEGRLVRHAIKRIHLGGNDVTKRLLTMLTEKGYYFETTEEYEIVREMKEKLCYASIDFEQELMEFSCSRTKERNYTLPDGNVITVGNQRTRCAEVLFQPMHAGKEHKGIHEVLFDSIMECSVGLRPTLFENIILGGGCAQIENFKDRMDKELRNLAMHDMTIKTKICNPNAAWFGGSILSSLSTFQQMWISKVSHHLM
jgi:actin